ncbi:MAG: hypothetical protein M3Y87_31220, partial [Myxococcota bacterium]|nr:hypothetical protein [Myxococcota bacterium]
MSPVRLPPDLVPVPRSADRARRFALVALLAAHLLAALWLLHRGELVFALATMALGLLIGATMTGPRAIALARLPAMSREALAARAALEEGDAAGARIRFEALCTRARTLGAYRAAFALSAAVATLESGDAARALAIVDGVLASGWLDHGSMGARFRVAALATRAMILLALGDDDAARETVARARAGAQPEALVDLGTVEALLAGLEARWTDALQIARAAAERTDLRPQPRRSLARLAALAARRLAQSDEAA